MTVYPPVPDWLQDSAEEYLSPEERRQLDVLFDRIWPANPSRNIPGAGDAQAGQYVTRLLARSPQTFRDIPKWRDLYRAGLKALDEHARSRYGKPLTAVDAAQVDEIINGLETQTITGLALPAGMTSYAFFDTLRRHCIQGCLSDPRWGGNANRRMWRALGFLQPAEDLS